MHCAKASTLGWTADAVLAAVLVEDVMCATPPRAAGHAATACNR
jgi:hypothetical protein